MAWVFNVGLDNLASDQVGLDVPRGVKITKTFLDESTGAPIVTVDSTKEEAKEQASPEFIEEYTSLARTTFLEQVDRLLNYENGNRETRPGSDASLLGIKLRESVETINYLLQG